MGTASTQRILSDATSFVGIQEGSLYFPHAAAFSGSCLVYSSTKGLEYLVENAGTITMSGTVVAAAAGQPILGVAIGPDPSNGFPAAYYTVFAQRDAAGGSKGGGIYRAQLPAACRMASGGDGGTATDAGVDAGGLGCGLATCGSGCCKAGVCQLLGDQDNACGSLGGMCNDCTLIASTCNQITKVCN